MNDEYVSNPRLRVLAEELTILNEKLITLNLPDRVRLFQLRDFAQSSRNISGITFPKLEITEDALYGFRYSIQFAPKYLGMFETPSQAISAYKAAHIDHHGIESKYHPDHPIDESHLFEGTLPPGITITNEGRFLAIIDVNKQRYSKAFSTIEEANAFRQTYIDIRMASRHEIKEAA